MLLSYKFREFPSVTALSILEGAKAGEIAARRKPSELRFCCGRLASIIEHSFAALSNEDLQQLFSPHDMKRLISYGNNMLDYHVILDLLPNLAALYFEGRFEATELRLSGLQSSILLALGLQRKSIEAVEAELNLPVSQALALFVKIIRKVTKTIEDTQKQEIDKSLPEEEPASSINGTHRKVSVRQELEDELNEEGDEATKQLRAQQRDIIDSLDLGQYAIGGTDDAFKGARTDKVISVKNIEGKRKEAETDQKQSKKRKKN